VINFHGQFPFQSANSFDGNCFQIFWASPSKWFCSSASEFRLRQTDALRGRSTAALTLLKIGWRAESARPTSQTFSMTSPDAFDTKSLIRLPRCLWRRSAQSRHSCVFSLWANPLTASRQWLLPPITLVSSWRCLSLNWITFVLPSCEIIINPLLLDYLSENNISFQPNYAKTKRMINFLF